MLSVTDFTSIINQLLPEPHAGLLNGILFGTKASLTANFKEALIRTGTIHITALSGMNITILMSLAASTLLHVFSRKTTSLLTIIFIIGFILFVGPSASVIRAGVMGTLTLIAIVLGKQRRALWFLIATTILMLIVYPGYLTDVGFQLSVLATLGIILFGKEKDHPREQKSQNSTQLSHFEGVKRQRNPVQNLSLLITFLWNLIKDDLRTTLSAQVFTTPLILFQFHRISLLAPIANVLIGFLIAPLTVLGMMLCLLGIIWLPIATPLSWIVWLILEYIVNVVEGISRIPFSSIGW